MRTFLSAARRPGRLAPTLLALLLAGGAAHAADREQRFAIEGVGRLKCSVFVEEAQKENSENLRLFVGYAQGYITAYNQFNDGVFDVTPWQADPLVLQFLATVCADNPEVSFGEAVKEFARALEEDALTTQTDMVEAKVGENRLFIYSSVLRDAQKELKERGHYSGTPDGAWGAGSERAFRAFQQTLEGAEVTGLPDQRSLYELFRPSDEELERLRAQRERQGGGRSGGAGGSGSNRPRTRE